MQNKHFFSFLDVPTFGEGSQAGLTEEKKIFYKLPSAKSSTARKGYGTEKVCGVDGNGGRG